MTIRLGIVGVGSMGRHHVRIARQTDGVELVALVDPAGDRFGVGNGMKVLPGVDDMISTYSPRYSPEWRGFLLK